MVRGEAQLGHERGDDESGLIGNGGPCKAEARAGKVKRWC